MKTTLCSLAAAAGLILTTTQVLPVPASAKQLHGDDTPIGSIRVHGKLTATGRAALARISFERALDLALTAHPGRVIYGELEVDDGNLDFDFEIIGENHQVTEVQIDAGNGQVLDISPADNV